MDFPPISSFLSLSERQKAALAKGGYKNISEALLATTNDLVRRCRITPQEANNIITLLCRERTLPPRPLRDFLIERDEKFTTGDPDLDTLLGGGIRTGMVWEVVGESAAGKTQLALQLSLSVQLPPSLAGVSGSACYITVASHLQTTRMEQILNAKPLFSPSSCTFSDIHTVQTPTIEKLIHVLSVFLPDFISRQSKEPSSKPLKLLVIDALAELFHSLGKTTTQTLVERSRRISEISTLLHILASKRRIAVLVLNEVVDVLDRESITNVGEMGYREQARWFGRAGGEPGGNRKEAALGLVWANQVNARIFLTRTGRRRYLEGDEVRKKMSMSQPATAAVPTEDQPTLVRRLSVVFSSVSTPAFCDYVVTAGGISVIPASTVSTAVHHPTVAAASASAIPEFTEPLPSRTMERHNVRIAPLDVGCVEDNITADTRTSTPEEPGDDEWDSFWAQNSLPDDVYSQLDLPSISSASNA
ncbi:P-loop containing nucleoside triphosphate hydrolase protein [Phlebopus sp. FC_14]|nr:P-loop containing nucleoside triphosphate hydrolase protein [Phlebopus sp. FC_14]